MQDLTYTGLSLGMWPAGQPCMLQLGDHCDFQCDLGLRYFQPILYASLCCRSGSWTPLTVGLTLKSLSDSKMNCQSNASLIKDLITLYSMCAFKEPIQDLLLAMVGSHCLKTCLSPMGRLGDWLGDLGNGPLVVWIA